MKLIDPNSLDLTNLKPIKTHKGNKASTLNGMGYVFFHISPPAQEFLQNEAKPGRKILEIGAGFGDITIQALKQNVGMYVANDLSGAHLELLAQRISQEFSEEAQEKFEHLQLLCGSVPEDLPYVENEFDAILIDKVMHFLSPSNVIKFIDWARRALKSQGKLYVITTSPYAPLLNKFAPEYERQKAEGAEFPGHFQNITSNFNQSVMQDYPDFVLPNEMVLFTRSDLIALFEAQGMKVNQSYSYKSTANPPYFLEEAPDNESNFVAVIVEKS